MTTAWTKPWSRVAVLTACLLLVVNVRAGANATELPGDVANFMAEHCLDCHNEAEKEGDLNLAELRWEFESDSALRLWMRIHDRVDKGEMPPADASAGLSQGERSVLLSPLAETLFDADYRYVQRYGRGPIRRLNRLEYENNLRDLLQLPHLDIRDYLPEDRLFFQSNKAADGLDLTRVQLAAYLEAADIALRQAVARDAKPRTPLEYRALATNMFPKAVDHAGRESSFYAKDSRMIPLSSKDLEQIRRKNSHDPEMEIAIFRSAAWPYYGYPENFLASDDGEYRVRFQARAVRQLRDFRLVAAPTSQAMTFRARQPSKADVSGDVRAVGGILDIQPQPQVYETIIRLKRGETFEYSLLGLPVPHPITSHGGPLYYDFPPMPDGGHRGVAFQWLEVTGPIDPHPWPPASHRVLFDALSIRNNANSSLGIEVITSQSETDAARLFRRFATNAARRPVSEAEVEPYLMLVRRELQSGVPFAESLLAGYRAFLCSPHFLFLTEPKSTADSYAIASRLSHLLWNTRPDDLLLQAAASNSLRDKVTVQQQAARMIQDPRFQEFIRNFANYWLDLRHVKRDSPDMRLYPEYRGDDYLIESMERETQAFLLHLFQENLPVANLVDANFVMINDSLSKHYELPPVEGSQMRPVPLPIASPRGGLLTQASILKITANGTTTSPVVRGAWVMDRIMGAPPPPPPTDVPAVEPDLRGATTIRQLLAKHAESPTCASCHAAFDPVGLALESFDVLGGYRTRYRSLQRGDEVTGIDRAGHVYTYHVAGEVDTSGQLEDGRLFEDAVELKRLLAAEDRQMARNLLERIVLYATGTQVRFSDRGEIETLLDPCAADGYRMRDLLTQLIGSRIFLGHASEASHDDF
ncbi:MAG: DUF1592 domain-containing protein [bacterium]|nr:DUF1592 domain-containing protein [bacterium]